MPIAARAQLISGAALISPLFRAIRRPKGIEESALHARTARTHARAHGRTCGGIRHSAPLASRVTPQTKEERARISRRRRRHCCCSLDWISDYGVCLRAQQFIVACFVLCGFACLFFYRVLSQQRRRLREKARGECASSHPLQAGRALSAERNRARLP